MNPFTTVTVFKSTVVNEPDAPAVDVPVPPCAIDNTPLKVIAPLVAVEGVKPVVPALKLVTPPVELVQLGTPDEFIERNDVADGFANFVSVLVAEA